MMASLDTLLSFAGVMLGLSLAITILNQAVSNALGLRAIALRWGLITMFNELYRDEMRRRSNDEIDKVPHIEKVVDFILHHPLITDSSMPVNWQTYLDSIFEKGTKKSETGQRLLSRLLPLFEPIRRRWSAATALSFDEFQRILALGASPSLADNSFKHVRAWTPIQSMTWLNRNLLVTPDWFESTMKRVRQRFAMDMKLWTMAFAILLVFFLHVDTFDTFRSLQSQPEAVARFNVKLEQLLANQPTPADTQEAQTKQLQKLSDDMKSAGLQVLPVDLSRHFPMSLLEPPPANASVLGRMTHRLGIVWNAFSGLSEGPGRKHVAGLFMTAALLSLGAPFWFNQLKNISTLRTVVAQTMDTPAKTKSTQKSLVSVQDGETI